MVVSAAAAAAATLRNQAAAFVLVVAVAAAVVAAPPARQELGCYWYPIEDASPVTNRSLASIPADTCTYVDIAGLCLFNVRLHRLIRARSFEASEWTPFDWVCCHAVASQVTAAGRLSWDAQQQAVPAHRQLGGSCLELAARTAADARAAKTLNPGLKFYWGMSGPMETMVRVYNDSTLREVLLRDLANFTSQFSDVVDGLAFDYEVHCESAHVFGLWCSCSMVVLIATHFTIECAMLLLLRRRYHPARPSLLYAHGLLQRREAWPYSVPARFQAAHWTRCELVDRRADLVCEHRGRRGDTALR